MYKLENNVQWTTGLKNAFKHNVTRASILYTDDNNETVDLNEENNLIELTLEDDRYIDGLGFIGSACAKKLDITIHDGNNSLNLENKVLTLKIGAEYNGSTYYINYGDFIVNEAPQIDETNNKMTITAYDYMIKFNQPYEDRVTYPTSLLLLAQDICSQAGVTLATTNFTNYDFIVTDNQFEGATLREVLQNIGKCAFSWARIGQDNRLYLDFSQTAENTETFTIDDYKTNGFKKSKEYYGPVNQVTYADSDIEGQEERVKDQTSITQNGLKELVIYDNLFAYTPEKRATLIQGGTRLFGLTYMPVSQLDSIGFIFLDNNDIINIETLDEQTYTTRVFNHTIKYTGTTSDSFVTEGTSNNEETYRNTATSVLQNQQTRIIVDKANKKISALVEENTEFNNKLVQLEASVDGISTEVDNMVDYRREASGTTQVYLENAGEFDIMELEIQGNKTYYTNLYPGEDLYPGEWLQPNMEVADFDL